MYTQSYYKNNNYIISNRNYSDDYANLESLEIDMTMSGKYLTDYPDFSLDLSKLCKYPSHYEIILLEEKLKKRLRIDKEVIVGSGSNGILHNLVKIFFKDGGNLVTPYLTFNIVEYGVSSLNGYTKRVFMNDLEIDYKRLYDSVDEDTKMIYICNPNNPTNIVCSNQDIIELANKVKCVVVIDEAGIEFSNQKSLIEEDFPDNVLVVRTFSKAYGLANLRVGYLVCDKETEKIYKENIASNDASGLSCMIAIKALESGKYIDNVKIINKEKEYLIKELEKIGVECYNSQSNTIFTKKIFDNKFIEKLHDNGVSLLPIYDQDNNMKLRIAIQDHNTNKEFIKRFAICYKNYYEEVN